MVTRDWKFWMEVEIGGVPKEQLITNLENEGFLVEGCVKSMIRQDAFTVIPEKRVLRLARCTVRDLGFAKSPTTTQLKRCIVELGGQFCPAELGPHLRLHLKNQERRDYFSLVMEQILVPDSGLVVFHLVRDDGGRQWLVPHSANPRGRWFLGPEVGFVLAS